ncbi:separase isoform X1 [Carex rostrata]
MDATASSLLASLQQGADHHGLHSRFSSYLRPFSDSKSSKSARSLAKRFLSFICKALNLLPALLRETSNVEERDTELLEIFELVLECLGYLLPVLEGEPYVLHLHRGVFVRCLVTTGKYEKAEAEAVMLLEDLISALAPVRKVSRSKNGKGKGAEQQILFPDPKIVGTDDSRITTLIIDITISLCNCAFNCKSKRPGAYLRILALVEQVQPWIRLLDHEAAKRNRLRFLRPLYTCAAFLTSECTSFDCDLITRFCIIMLRECASCSFNQLTISASKICSRVDLNWDDGPSIFFDVLRITLELSLCECKDQVAKGAKDFLDLLSSTSDILYDAQPNICKLASDTLNDHVQKFVKLFPPVGLILSLYSAALYFKSTIPLSQTGDDTPLSCNATILSSQKELQSLLASVETLSSYFSEKKGGYGNASGLFLAYLDALEFLCQVLLPCAKTGWRRFCSEGKDFPNSSNWSNIFKVLQEFCSFTINAFRATTKNDIDKERTDRKRKLLLESLVSGFRICFFSAVPYEMCSDSISIVLSSEWVSPTELKYFVSSLSNTGQTLYQIRSHVKQAPVSVALKLYCEAVLANLRRICHNYSVKSSDISNDSLKNINETVSDGYKRIGSIILLFHECHPGDITSIADITVRTLFEMSLVDDLHRIQSNSFSLVKEWVKVLCKEYNDADKKYDAPFLYHLLMKKKDKQNFSRMSLGRIIEKELLVYQQLESRYPNLCKIMQGKVIKVLLEDLYSEKDSFLERSRILIAKARYLRASGVDSLKGSLDCLFEAISLLRDAKSDSCNGQALAYHQLATAYCLHAQCAQEDKLDFEVILGEIDSALDLWLRIDIENYTCSDGGFELVVTNMVPMLCSLIDLLSIKGCYKHHSRICKLMAKTFKHESIPVEKLFALLFSDRRLGHTNCGVQMDLELISDALQNCDASAHLTKFWASCLEGHNPSLSMFAQSMLLNCLVFPEVNEKGFEKSLQCKLGIKEIKQIASSLISDPKPSSRSAFIAGYLYYDLSQRFLSEGKLFEALSCAKEAFNLRTKLLHRKFMYFHKNPYDVHLQTRDSVATETWPDFTRAHIIVDSFLSPWIVLRCYLESTFQVGSIYESIGNGAEAEFMFRTGKEISHLQVLHSFEIIFASSLGQLYRKWQLWDIADSELKSAQKLLQKSKPALSCGNCKMFLETTVNLQLGDLLHSRFKNSFQNRSLHTQEDALCTYQSAFDKLDHDKLEFSKMEEAETNEQLNSTCKFCMLLKQPAESDFNKKASRNHKATLKDLNSDTKKPTRTTRARSCKTSTVTETKEKPAIEFNNSNKMGKKPSSKCNGDVTSYKRMCWACLMNRTLDSGSLTKLLHLGVEFRRSSFLLLLQLKIARMSGAQGVKSNVHEVHSLYRKCLLLLFSRSPGADSSEVHARQLMELIEDEQWKALSINRALILYNMSLFMLKYCLSDQYRDACCTLANFQMQDVLTWLLRAFILSREFPLLLQKVSRLLASTLILSTVDRSIPLPLHLDKSLSLNHWTSYFHQASISTSLDTLYQCAINKIPPNVMAGAKDEAYSNNIKILRFPFENFSQLEEHVGCFFKKLPDVPIICISMIGGDYASLLEETLILPSFCPAWVMLSKIDSTNRPITMLLPADKIREVKHDIKTCKQTGNIQQAKEWQCPWGHTVLDHVAPSFKLLMKENLLSSHETVKQNFWEWRTEINNRLGSLLRNIDESWFGPWSCLLRGYPINDQNKELLVPTLINHLEPLISSEVNPSLVRAILGGSESLVDAKACFSQLISYGESFGHGGFSGEDRFRAFSASRGLGSKIPDSIDKVLQDAFCGPVPVNREPVIFVLDTDVQMLPWESIPGLRRQEVYRMPSMGSIFLTLDRNYQRHREKEREELLFSNSYFPKVDPFDTYYLLNPSGDLKDTEDDLKLWLEGLNFEGKTRVAQTSEELALVLRNHDMFFYFGHGSGTQYIPRHEIEKLEIHAAALLMGCSSGVLTCKGSYAPQGTPLSYLFAGSPAVIANLWDITDRDIDKFSKGVVNSWLQSEAEVRAVSCSACAIIEEPRRGRGRKTQANGHGSYRRWCKGCATRQIASSIGKAREECKLDMLTGAAPVCYGVPTVLRRKS